MVAEYPMELQLHVTSVMLAGIATVWAIYLIPLARRAAAWVLLSIAFILFAADRVLELLVHRGLLMGAETGEAVSDVLHIFISAFLFGGVFCIRKIFLERQLAQRKLQENLDELQRFYNASTGRELRMQELFEENQALKTRLGGQKTYPSVELVDKDRLPVAIGTPPAGSAAEMPQQRTALLFMLEDLERSRRQVEQAHQEWVAALDAVNDPIFLHDQKFRILRCNKAYQQRAGIPFEQIIGQPYYEIFPKSDSPLPCCLRAMEKAEEEEEVIAGGIIYRSRAFSIKDGQGGYLYSVHTLEDITERERAAEALSESETRFRNLVETSSDWIWEVDENTVYTYASPKIHDILGYQPAEIIGKTPYDLMPPAEATRVAALFDRIRAAKESFTSLENTNLHKDGRRVVLETNGVPVIDPQGKFRGYRGMDRDITARKQAEALLAESEEKFRKITASAQDAIIMMGTDQRITFWNAAAERIFGYTSEEALGQELHCLVAPPAAQAAFTHGFQHFRYSGEGPVVGKVIEVGALRKGGEEFPVELAISATQLNGQWHAIGIVRDITGRKRTEIAIQHANRAIATLGAVNHELVHATNENELLQAICLAIVEQRGYQLAWVGYVQHDDRKSIKIIAHAGSDEGYLDSMQITWAEGKYGMGPSGRAVRSGVTQVSQDVAGDPLYLPWRDAALQHGYLSSIALPLLDGDRKVFGLLNVYAAEANAFIPAEITLLEEMAGDLAFGVRSLRVRQERDRMLEQNQQQMVQLQDNLEDTVRAIATIVEMRDPYTAGHQVRVADLASAIATQMGLPDEQVHAIHLAGVVHDLGKIQIPAEILSKPGRITDLEFSFIKTHAQAGYDILKGIAFPWPIAQMVLQHHERLDGSGYPQGLKGDAILLEARILSVADVVEAMSSHRPYRPGLGVETALAEITGQRSIYYDPVVVDACLALFREQHYSFK